MAFQIVTRKVALPEVIITQNRAPLHPFKEWFGGSDREDKDSFFIGVSYLDGRKAADLPSLRTLLSGQFNEWRKALPEDQQPLFDRTIISRRKGETMADGEKAPEDGIEFFILISKPASEPEASAPAAEASTKSKSQK